MRILPFTGLFPNVDLIASPELFFDQVSNQYLDFKKAGFFKEMKEPGFYIYQIQNAQNAHLGLIACHDLRDFDVEKILGHENTLAEREQEIMQLMMLRKAMIKPVLLAYPPVDEIDQVLNDFIGSSEPFITLYLPNDQEWHRVWFLSDPVKIENVTNLFKDKVETLFIADGHHRSATTIKLLKNHYLTSGQPSILSCYFSFDQLKIYDYNRVVDVFANISPTAFMAAVSNYGKIKPMKVGAKPKKKFEFTMYIYKEWYKVSWNKAIINRFSKSDEPILDTAILNEVVMSKILKIKDARTAQTIKYISGKSGLTPLIEEVNKNKNSVGFCVYPVEPEELISVSLAGKTLPPKSTWFEPRIKNGLLVKEL